MGIRSSDEERGMIWLDNFLIRIRVLAPISRKVIKKSWIDSWIMVRASLLMTAPAIQRRLIIHFPFQWTHCNKCCYWAGLTWGIRKSRSRFATCIDVTEEAAPTTPEITFRTWVLLVQWYSGPTSMLLIEPKKGWERGISLWLKFTCDGGNLKDLWSIGVGSTRSYIRVGIISSGATVKEELLLSWVYSWILFYILALRDFTSSFE